MMSGQGTADYMRSCFRGADTSQGETRERKERERQRERKGQDLYSGLREGNRVRTANSPVRERNGRERR